MKALRSSAFITIRPTIPTTLAAQRRPAQAGAIIFFALSRRVIVQAAAPHMRIAEDLLRVMDELAQELDVPLRAVKKLVHYCEAV